LTTIQVRKPVIPTYGSGQSSSCF